MPKTMCLFSAPKMTREQKIPFVLVGGRQYRYCETALTNWIRNAGNRESEVTVMKNEKALVLGETKGLDNSFEHRYFKPIQCLRQEKKLAVVCNKSQPKHPKLLRIIQYFDCKRQSENDGYRLYA